MDIQECSYYKRDDQFPLDATGRPGVFFGAGDSLFTVRETDLMHPSTDVDTKALEPAFWQRHFQSVARKEIPKASVSYPVITSAL